MPHATLLSVPVQARNSTAHIVELRVHRVVAAAGFQYHRASSYLCFRTRLSAQPPDISAFAHRQTMSTPKSVRSSRRLSASDVEVSPRDERAARRARSRDSGSGNSPAAQQQPPPADCVADGIVAEQARTAQLSQIVAARESDKRAASPLRKSQHMQALADDDSYAKESDDSSDEERAEEVGGGGVVRKASLSGADVEDGAPDTEANLVICCVPDHVCEIGLVDPGATQHQCRHCNGFFNAPCAYNRWGSDVYNDCGCTKYLLAPVVAGNKKGKAKALGKEESDAEKMRRKADHEAAAKLVEPPANYSPDELEGWRQGLKFEHNHYAKAPPPSIQLTELGLAAYKHARETLKKKKAAEKKKKERRAAAATASKRQKIQINHEEGHQEEPGYLASIGKASRGSGSPSANEMARLVHVLADDAMQEACAQIREGFRDRLELDDKVNRVMPYKDGVKLYNSADFSPTNEFLQDANSFEDLREINPATIERLIDEKQFR
eukprot:scaffold267648_cov15-Prasinocladus_malaysianus.AAC.1